MNRSFNWTCAGFACFLAAAAFAFYANPVRPAAAQQKPVNPRGVDFNREIRPILSDTCFACHGPDEKQRQVDLRLDTKEGIFADRGGYQVIIPGKASESRLFQRISAENKIVRMPPPKASRTLTPAQIELVRRWIDEGAKWETHWSYLPPQRPELPKVRRSGWTRNPIDNFVLARLEQEGLAPSPEADKATLIRRVTLDLTGLPPTPAEVDTFLADRSANSFEKVVDRLLASPRYGERMALQWLDLARYADTHGYHIDSHRDMWHWREWVIDAFNRNLPFDRFTTEQLAGDLLPGAGLEQKIATGFNRNHMINYEGGAIPEEYLNEYVVDRVETTATVWMGMTMGCARCHDHKYDPIKQREFYQFYAFFNNIPEKGLDGRYGNADPVLQLPSDQQRRELAELTSAIAAHKKRCRKRNWPHFRLNGKKREFPRSRSLRATGLRPITNWTETWPIRPAGTSTERPCGAKYFMARALSRARPSSTSKPTLNSEAWAPSILRADFRSPSGFAQAASVRWPHWRNARNRKTGRGYELGFDEAIHVGDQKRGAHLYFRLVHRAPGEMIEIRTRERLLQNEWHHVTITYDGSAKAAGVKLYLNGKPKPFDVVRDRLTGSILTARPLEVGNKKLGNPYKGFLDDLRFYNRELTAEESDRLAIHYPIRMILSGLAGKRTKEQQRKLREYFLRYDAPEPFRKSYAELKSLESRKTQLNKIIPTAMVMQEMEKPRDTFVLGRGDYRNRGEKVAPGVPSILPPLPKDSPANRLTLARWLVDPAHPLTARVAVNRYWQIYFGKGLVKTAEDFGSQGEPPSHPELLDWLATEFIRTGWDIKAMQRLIVTSATYRQSSRVTPELLEKDPENRWLAHGPRFRLPAETVRDNALAISGLLHEERGGPGVSPYQPKGVWEEIAYGDVFSAQTYTQGTGKDLYRRSMYTFWKRTAPPPSLAAFDAPDREKCTARRAVTNTPLQALVLMNDPTYVEAARALAERMIREAGSDPDRRIALAYRLATARKPGAEELRVLRDLAHTQLAHYRREREAAAKLVRVGESEFNPKLDVTELAAWTTVASAILNLDETITKE